MSFQVKFLSSKATAPTRGSAFAAGYDLYAYVFLSSFSIRFLLTSAALKTRR